MPTNKTNRKNVSWWKNQFYFITSPWMASNECVLGIFIHALNGSFFNLMDSDPRDAFRFIIFIADTAYFVYDIRCAIGTKPHNECTKAHYLQNMWADKMISYEQCVTKLHLIKYYFECNADLRFQVEIKREILTIILVL